MKKMRKMVWRIILLTAVALLTVFTGCGKKETAGTADVSRNGGTGKYKIAFLVLGLDDVWHNVTSSATKKYIESMDPDIQIDIFDAKSKQDLLLNHFETAFNGGYKIVLGGPSPEFDETALVASFKEKGVPVIGYSFEEEGSGTLFSAILCSDYNLGLASAERAAQELPQGAKIVYLDGPVYSGSILRRKGLQDGLLNKRPDIQLLDEQIANFAKSEAMEKMDDWIQRFGKIDGVLAANDSMALGAIESLRANGFNIADVYVYGIDSVPEACLAIQAGELRLSAFQDPMAYVKAFHEIVENFKNGKTTVDDTRIIYIDASYTDSSNVEDRIAFYREAGAMK
ncbi:MAG: sugar ABC transporter substrate-binding protein [Treponema sp.]|jgi:inositol transport system substrate-binding protein|nr:sugar ABC transporter substrate-binding protein [Treponema sp.]